MRQPLVASIALAAASLLAGCAASAPPPAAAPAKPAALTSANVTPQDGAHGFDFMHGKFTLKVRRLRHPLHGASDWYEMTGTTECRPFWGGVGNVEEAHLEGPDGPMDAVMARLYSEASGQWSLNWATKKSARFDVPTIGEFRGGRGEFYDQEMFEGRAILVRYVWSDTNTSAPHFQQSFSADGGKTWELNWDAYSTRIQ